MSYPARSRSFGSHLPAEEESSRLLLVCDDLTWCDGRAGELLDRGYDVMELKDGEGIESFLQALERGRVLELPEVVVMRIAKASPLGVELLRALRHELGPCVVVTARDPKVKATRLDADIEVSLSCDIDDLLTLVLNLSPMDESPGHRSGVHPIQRRAE